MNPGEYFLDVTADTIWANAVRRTTTVQVTNRGDRSIQVGSHFPFSNANKALDFDREVARGMHLNIPAGTSRRFEPGESKTVELVTFGGSGIVRDSRTVRGAATVPAPYAKVQFIAHAIHTAPKPKGKTQEYMGLDVTSEDIAERIKFVGKVIEAARTRPETKQGDASVLKLFMMPEFFFRGKDGAYSMDEVQEIISALQTLVKEAARWEHWLFVFGTIVGHSIGVTMIPGMDIEAYNYALVQQGGFGDAPGAGPAAAKAVVKEYRSNIDFIKYDGTDGMYLERVYHLEPLKPPGSRSEEQVTSYDGSCIFHLRGHHIIGLEICLDHAARRLKTALKRPVIAVQLVPSCGMEIKNNAIVAKKGGYIFLCDGLHSYDSRMLPYNSQVRKIGTGAVNPAIELNVDATGIQIDKIFARGPGKLLIYPALDLA